MMKITIIILCATLIPIATQSQIVAKDTTIKGEMYKVFPYTMYFEDIEEDIKNEEDINEMKIADYPTDDVLPSIPALNEKLPDGQYISLDRYYNSDDKIKSYINSYFSVENGAKNGLCIFKNEKGKVIGKGLYQNDLKNGKWDYYCSQNKIHYIINYDSGVVEKEVLIYNGKRLIGKGWVLNDELVGDYWEYYNNGKLKRYSRIPQSEGTPDGVFCDVSHDDCDSLYAEYHENGKPKIVIPCKNGYGNINHTEYDRNGGIVETVNLLDIDGGNRILKKTKYFKYLNEINVYDYKKQESTLLYTLELTKDGDTVELKYSPKYYIRRKIDQDKDTSILIQRRKSNYAKYIEEKYIHLATKKEYSIIYNFSGQVTYAPQIKKMGDNKYRFAEPHYDETGAYNIVSYKTYRGFVDTFNYGNAFTRNSFSYAYSLKPEIASDTMEFFHNGELMNEILFYPAEYLDKEYSPSQIFISKIKHRKYPYRRIQNKIATLNFLEHSYIVKTLSMKQYRKLNGYDNYYSRSRDSATLILPYHYKKGNIQFTQYLHRLLLHNGKVEGELVSDRETYTYAKGIKHGSYKKEHFGESSTGYYENGLKNGVFIEWNTKIMVKVLKNDTIDGTVIELDYKTKQPSCIYTMNMGVPNGHFILLSSTPHDTLTKAILKNNFLHGNYERNQYVRIAKESSHNASAYVSALQEIQPTYRLARKYIANFENGIPKGIQYFYDKNGNLQHTLVPNDTQYRFDFQMIENYENSNGRGTESLIAGLKGIHQYYFKNGKVSEEGVRKDIGFTRGKKDSIWNYYNENGVLYKQCDYRKTDALSGDSNASIYGSYTTFYPDGKIHEKGFISKINYYYDCDQERDIEEEEVLYTQIYDNAGMPALANGTGMVTIYYNTGVIKGKGYQKDTLRNGFWVLYDKNGNPNEAGEYVNGEKNGRWLSGNLKGFRFIDNMCFSSEVDSKYIKEKAETGLNISETIYKNGELIVEKEVTIYRSDRPRRLYGGSNNF